MTFQLGDIFSAEVIELQPQRAMIISYQGSLFRVVNHTTRRFQVGSQIKLIVQNAEPLELKIYERSSQSFDRMV